MHLEKLARTLKKFLRWEVASCPKVKILLLKSALISNFPVLKC